MADISTSSTNADLPNTTDNGGGDFGLDGPLRTLINTQATTNQYGYNVGIPLPDETGSIGSILRNPETGELYSSTLRINPETGNYYDTGGLLAPTSAGVGLNDDNSVPTGDPSPDAGDNIDAGGGWNPAGSTTSPSANSNSVSGSLNSNSRPLIVPQPNVLDKFSSYTYRISVYLMTPTQYEQLARSHKKNVNGYNLLFQSGGAPTNVGGFQGMLSTNNASGAINAQAEGGRNPAFPLDFYIDSCTITNLLQGKGTGAAHSVATMKFNVIEPVGITLIDRIYEAVQDSAPTESTGKVNYQAVQYLMAIRFYGYDQNGNIINGAGSNSDPRAAIEKFIPFVINKINWRVTNKATEYEFDCTPVGQNIAGGTRRGVVPYDIQLSQGTVGKLLAGDLAFTDRTAGNQQPGASTTAATEDDARDLEGSSNPPPPKANAAATPKQTVKQGLMAAMNEFTKNLTIGKNPVYEIADQYEIVFAKGAEAIRDATIVLPEAKKEAKKVPMNQPATENSQSLNPATQAKDTSIATQSIYAGQPIVQIIDQVIRNSSYISKQALTVIDKENEKPNDDNMQKQKPVDWYRIDFEAVPIGNKQDSRRNDFAYKIKYIISTYKIDNYDSKYFPIGSFRGVHKSYPWIFTGKNTAVLDYSETLNSAYNMLVSGSDPTNSAAEIERRKIAATMRELVTYTYGARSAETNQGSRYKGNEVGANIADSLYASADLGETKLRIIGDPAWIQQGSLAGGIAAEMFNPSSFLPDGTINFDAEQILFEVTWSRPADYNINTGLADPNSINKPPISRVYTAKKVTSEFKQGKFETVIEGLFFALPKPDGSNKAPTARMPTKGDVTRETAARTGVALTAEAAQAARTAFAAIDPRRVDKAAAGIGGNSAVSEPQTNLPVNNQQVNTDGTPNTPADSVRQLPPPQPASSGTGEDLGVVVDELGQASRFRRNLETGDLYDPGNSGILITPQDISWEP